MLTGETFSDDVVAKFIALGKLTQMGVDAFTTSKAAIPVGSGPYSVIVDTTGPMGMKTHDDNYELKRPHAQASVRASLASVAKAKAQELRQAIGAGWFNVTINGTFYVQIVVQGEVRDLEQDAKGRPRFGFTITSIQE